MEESQRRSYGGGIMEEESWWRNRGGEITEEESWRGIMEDASCRRYDCGGSKKGAARGRQQVNREIPKEAPSRHQETFRRHPRATQEAPRGPNAPEATERERERKREREREK